MPSPPTIDSVYIVTDYGVNPNNVPATNTLNLRALVSYVETNGGGGIILFPPWDGTTSPGAYYFQTSSGAAVISMGSLSSQILFCGTGLGATLIMQSNGDFFDIDTTNYIAFQDLTIEYDHSAGALSGTAINYLGAQGCYLFRVNLVTAQRPSASHAILPWLQIMWPLSLTARFCILVLIQSRR